MNYEIDYIKILKYAVSQPNDFGFADLVELLETKIDSEKAKKLAKAIEYRQILFTNDPDQFGIDYSVTGKSLPPDENPQGYDYDYRRHRFTASVEDHFRLIEYRKLKEAEGSSKMATWSLWISIFVLAITCITTFISIKQMSLPINVPEDFRMNISKISDSSHGNNTELQEIKLKLDDVYQSIEKLSDSISSKGDTIDTGLKMVSSKLEDLEEQVKKIDAHSEMVKKQ